VGVGQGKWRQEREKGEERSMKEANEREKDIKESECERVRERK
jgi:hypothetical protein